MNEMKSDRALIARGIVNATQSALIQESKKKGLAFRLHLGDAKKDFQIAQTLLARLKNRGLIKDEEGAREILQGLEKRAARIEEGMRLLELL